MAFYGFMALHLDKVGGSIKGRVYGPLCINKQWLMVNDRKIADVQKVCGRDEMLFDHGCIGVSIALLFSAPLVYLHLTRKGSRADPFQQTRFPGGFFIFMKDHQPKTSSSLAACAVST